jgi:hypothetical protein
MVQIVVTAEQAKQLGKSSEPIEIVDQEGNRIGYYTQPFTNAEIAEARRRSESETGGRTTQEVLDRISKMESE